MRRIALALSLFAELPTAARGQSAPDQQDAKDAQAEIAAAPLQATDAWRPPTLTIERYREDWSRLADPANQTGHWTEPFKYIPLDAGGGTYLTTGLEVRERFEGYQGNGWGSTPDQGYFWTRVMPYADLHVGSVRFFAQPIFAYASGVKPAPGPIDRTGADLLQGFVDVGLHLGHDTTVRVEVGRQMFGLGTERLIGTRYGPNVPMAFDGTRAIVHHGRTRMILFYARPVDSRPGDFDDRSSHTKAVWGAYATRWLDTRQTVGLDFYYLGFRDRQAVMQQGVGREERSTFGARWFGTASGWHWNVEGAYQTGRFAGAPVRAWAVYNEVGRSFAASLAPDLTLRTDIISGDRNAGRPEMQGFNSLFPKGQYFGELSPVGPRNIIDVHPALTLHPGPKVSVGVSVAAYWRESLGDGVYDIPGHLLRASAPGQSRFIGKEAEIAADWQATPELTLSASFGAFAPGPFIRETGSDRLIRMTGLDATFRF